MSKKREKEKRKVSKSGGEITRRAFLESGVQAAKYGAIGAAAGWAYDSTFGAAGRLFSKAETAGGNTLYDIDKAYDKKTKAMTQSENPVVRAVGKTGEGLGKVEQVRGNIWDKMLGRTPEAQRKWREEHKVGEYAQPKKQDNKPYEPPEKPRTEISREQTQYPPTQPDRPESPVSRRSFFKTLLGYANDHPIKTGAIAGATYGAVYGAGKGAKKGYNESRKNKKDYEHQAEVDELRDELNSVKKGLEEVKLKPHQNTGGLEHDVLDGFNGGSMNTAFLTLGITGIFVAIIFGAIKFTGFAVYSNSISTISVIGALIFLVSIFLILFGIAHKKL